MQRADLSGKMFIFGGTTADYVTLFRPHKELNSTTVCLRSTTDENTGHHFLFQMVSASMPHFAFRLWKLKDTRDYFMAGANHRDHYYREHDYKINTWQSICFSWDGLKGLAALYLDGKPYPQQISPKALLEGGSEIVLGQFKPF